MFGEGQQEDIDINGIDFEWVKKTTKPKLLRKALRILQDDGGYYFELQKAVEEKLCECDPKYRKKQEMRFVDPNDVFAAKQDINEWEEQQQTKQKNQIFSQDNTEEQMKRKIAENEKIKGNEAMKSNDLKEALQYYTKSIEYDSTLTASYCNRALVHLKMKDYQKCIDDCNTVLQIDPVYLKAYHRRGKARMELKLWEDALEDFEKIMEKDPKNEEVNADLKQARSHITKKQGPKAFKKINIVEEEDEEEAKEQTIQQEEEGSDETIANFEAFLERSKEQKTRAQEQIQQGSFPDAINSFKGLYTSLINFDCKDNEEVKKSVIREYCACANNIALCNMQLHDHTQVIEWINIIEQNRDILDSNLLVKAFLRRGLAYERSDRVQKARDDFRTVKSYDLNNKQASDALHRLRPTKDELQEIQEKRTTQEIETLVQQSAEVKRVEEVKKEEEVKKVEPVKIPEQVQEKTVNKTDELYFEVENIKLKGNDLFKRGEIEQAIEVFAQGINKFEQQEDLKQLLKQGYRMFQTIFIQLNTNCALCYLNTRRFQECIDCSTRVIQLENKNLKALYRRGQSYLELARVQEQSSLNCYEFYRQAKSDLQTVYVHENQQNVKEKLDECVRKIILLENTLSLNKKQEETLKVEEVIQPQQQKETQESNKNQNFSRTNVDREFVTQVTDSVVGGVIERLITEKNLPKSASAFEKDCQAFKKNNNLLCRYLKKIPFDYLSQLFSKKELTTENFMQMVQTFTSETGQENPQFASEFLQNLNQTNKFNLVLKMLTKGERQSKFIIEKLKT